MAIRRLALGVTLTLSLLSSSARADVVPDGRKTVKLSIEVTVDAKPPEGRALLLLNTWQGATELTPGKAAEFEWHPMHGKVQLVSVTAAQKKAIAALAEKHRGAERFPMMQAQSTACAAPFDGVRTVEDGEPYDEIRWHYAVAFEGDGCLGKLARTSYLDDGQAVKSEPSVTAPSSTPTATPTPTPEPKADAAAAASPTKAKPKPASACSIARPGDDPTPGPDALSWLIAGLWLVRRRVER